MMFTMVNMSKEKFAELVSALEERLKGGENTGNKLRALIGYGKAQGYDTIKELRGMLKAGDYTMAAAYAAYAHYTLKTETYVIGDERVRVAVRWCDSPRDGMTFAKEYAGKAGFIPRYVIVNTGEMTGDEYDETFDENGNIRQQKGGQYEDDNKEEVRRDVEGAKDVDGGRRRGRRRRFVVRKG